MSGNPGVIALFSQRMSFKGLLGMTVASWILPKKPINFVPQDRKKSRPENGMDVMDDEGEEPILERPLPGPDIILNYGMPLSVVFEALDLI